MRHPNKRFQIKQTDREERVYEYLKNVWTVCKFFFDNYMLDLPTINGDQMPLHRSESSTQKILNFVDMDAYVKENYNLSFEIAVQITTLIQNSFSKEKELELSWILQVASNLKGMLLFRSNVKSYLEFAKQI